MSVFRIFIGDSDEIVRLGLHAILEPNKKWTICGEAEDGDHVVAEVERLKPDLVILGTHMDNLGVWKRLAGSLIPTCKRLPTVAAAQCFRAFQSIPQQ